MREFYEACSVAMDAKKIEAAVAGLREAHDIMLPLVRQARVRCEFRLIHDLWAYLGWAAAYVIHNMFEDAEWPGAMPFDTEPGTTYVYPPVTKNHQSIDYRWNKRAELPETMLPSIPIWAHRWPVVRDKTVYELVRP